MHLYALEIKPTLSSEVYSSITRNMRGSIIMIIQAESQTPSEAGCDSSQRHR